MLCGFFLYLRFEFGMSPLQRYYLPYSIRTWTSGWRQSTGQYQLLYVAGPGRQPRVALDSDVQSGETRQPGQRPLPVQLSGAARSAGYTTLFREAPRAYQNRGLSLFLRHWIYDDAELFSYFRAPALFGLLALLIQLPFSLRKDIARRKQLRYGRRLKGPILVDPKEFTKQLAGDGIGLQVEGHKALLRIPREAENTHFLIVGDTGSGKSTIIRSILCQVAERGHSAIVYDPACEFVRQFYSPDRGDIVLNPLDERCPVLESIRRIATEGGGQGTGRFALPARRQYAEVFRRKPAEDLRPSALVFADADRAGSLDVAPGRNRPPRQRHRTCRAH